LDNLKSNLYKKNYVLSKNYNTEILVKEDLKDSSKILEKQLEDTINLCKTKFIPKEDRAEIYALKTDPEKLEINDENEEEERPFNKQTNSFKIENDFGSYNQEASAYAPREIDDKDYMRELIDICNQNGETPPYEDFNQNGWEHFYSGDDPFFLWDKGQVIPNRLKVSYPNDYKKLEIYQGDMTPDLTTRQGFGILTTPFFVRIGQWRYNQFTGWGRESRRNGEVLEGRFTNGRVNGKGIFITVKGNKYGREEEIYECENCSSCPFRDKCFKGKTVNRQININQELTDYHNEVIKNLESIHGALLRMNRSIHSK